MGGPADQGMTSGQPGQPGQDPNLAPPGGEGDPQSKSRAVVMMGAEIDRALLGMAQVMPDSSEELTQARQLIQRGIGKFLAAQGQAPSTSATATGAQFPGGGVGGGL